MIQALLCRLNIGHHWLAETDSDGGFRRHCTKCGKYDPSAKWSGHLSAQDRPGNRWGPDPD
jgi:hypothetical protein